MCRKPSTNPFSKITSYQPHKSPRNTTYSSRALMFTSCPLFQVPRTPYSSPAVTAQIAWTSYAPVAMEQRQLTTTADPFIFLQTFYPYTARLIISLAVLCLSFSSSAPHSNLPDTLHEKSRLYCSPLSSRANRPVPPFRPHTLQFTASFHVSLRVVPNIQFNGYRPGSA
jgi:hypothetical protein